MINFLLKVLFLTDVWIIIYTNLVDYLNFAFPPAAVATYGNPLPHPETFEVPLYLLITLFFVAIIWIYDRHLKHIFVIRMPLFLKIVLFFFLLGLFANTLGTYPLSGHPYPYLLRPDKQTYIFVLFLYFLAILFITAQAWVLQKIVRGKKFSLFIYLFLILVVAILVFDARFPVLPPDAAFFYGPVYELAHGKTLFTDIPSFYGFFSILFFSLIYKLLHVPFAYLPVLIWLFFILEYVISFYLIWKVGQSLPLALLGLFSLLTTSYFSVYRAPQSGPLRWIPIFVFLFLVYKLKKIDSNKLLMTIPLLAFWNIDSGIALLLAYVLTLGMFFLLKKISLKSLISTAVKLILFTLLTLAILQALHIVLGRKPLDLIGIYQTIKINVVLGILMIPIETHTYFWLSILLYFAVIIYVFRQNQIELGGEKERDPASAQRFFQPAAGREHLRERISSQNLTQLLLFSANLMLFASIYYVGRSDPHNLFIISPFVVLTFFLLSGSIYKQIASKKTKLALLFFVLVFLIILPAYKRKEFLVEDLLNKYHALLKGKIFSFENDERLKKQYKREIGLINNAVKEDEIVILTIDDTYLFYLTNKKNLLDANPILQINREKEMDKATERLTRACPKKIAVDCTVYKKCQPYKYFAESWPPIVSLALNTIEKKCKIKYEPVTCTDQLCIAEH